MTSFSEIITNSAMVQIDDVRLNDLLNASPALFFRKMNLYINLAIPLLARPPELLLMLQKDLEEAKFDDYEWVSTEESTQADETIVETGKTGFDLCSVTVLEEDGLIEYNAATYDKETGNIIFPKQTESGITYQIDFYSDGYISADLTMTQRRLLGLAIAVVWDERFTRDWLAITMKISDDSFSTVNESNYIDKVQTRLIQNRQALNDELRKYEQNCEWNKTVPKTSRALL